MELTAFQDVVSTMADIADSKFTACFDHSLPFDIKPDGSRVTRLDHGVERAWREILDECFPLHSVVGEEYGGGYSDEGFCWYLDPVDGTDDLTRGIPLSGFVISLAYRGFPIVAAVGHPALRIRAEAVFDQGSYVNGHQVDEFDSRHFDEPAVALPATEDWMRIGDKTGLSTLLGKAYPNHRVYRNVFGHTCVLTGALEAAIECDVAEWDVLATRLLIEEAGGCYVPFCQRTDSSGIRRVSVIFGNPSVVDGLLSVLSSAGIFPD